MIDIEQVEESVHWLIDNARKLGAARKRAVLAERMVERKKALLMKKHSDLAVAAQEREAKASDEMHEAYLEEAQAAGELEYYRSLRDAHVARLELFRTLESTARQIRKEATHGPQVDPSPR